MLGEVSGKLFDIMNFVFLFFHVPMAKDFLSPKPSSFQARQITHSCGHFAANSGPYPHVSVNFAFGSSDDRIFF